MEKGWYLTYSNEDYLSSLELRCTSGLGGMHSTQSLSTMYRSTARAFEKEIAIHLRVGKGTLQKSSIQFHLISLKFTKPHPELFAQLYLKWDIIVCNFKRITSDPTSIQTLG